MNNIQDVCRALHKYEDRHGKTDRTSDIFALIDQTIELDCLIDEANYSRYYKKGNVKIIDDLIDGITTIEENLTNIINKIYKDWTV